jgi:hypothetical protein
MCETGCTRSRQPSSTQEGFLCRTPKPTDRTVPEPRARTSASPITTITPLSDRCREWLEDNVAIEPWQRFGSSIAVEPRYVEQLAEAMIEDGLVIEPYDLSEED